MEIILREDIIGLGYKNDIVNVKSGYGRNYLIPTGKAIIASESAKKVLAENLRQQAHKLAAIKANAEKRAAELEGVELTIEVKVSATLSSISDNVTKLRINIQEKNITKGSYGSSDEDIANIQDKKVYTVLFKQISTEVERLKAMK